MGNVDVSKTICEKCGESRFKLWANKKGATCQKCGNFVILEKTSGYETSHVWSEGELKDVQEEK